MDVITLDTNKYIGMLFTGTDKPVGIHYDPDDEQLLFDPDDIFAETPIRGVIVAEVADDMMSNEQALADAWGALWLANDESGDWLTVSDVLAGWDLLGVVAVEVTTQRMACGPVSETVFYLVNASDWRHVKLLSEKE